MGVLVVGDEASAIERLAASLTADGFVVAASSVGTNLHQRLYRRDSDAIVFDLRRLYSDIVDSISELRAHGFWTPILVAVGTGDRDELSRVLDAGADDYLAKPVPHEEIAARLRALIRRASAPRWAPLECGAVVLTPDVAEINVAGESVKLSPRERSLLQLLLRRRMQIVSREEILADVFGYDFNPRTNLIDVQITRLRQKLASGGIMIEAIRGQGFRLKPTGPKLPTA
jgi:DNA-binding response OmpR family regulator